MEITRARPSTSMKLTRKNSKSISQVRGFFWPYLSFLVRYMYSTMLESQSQEDFEKTPCNGPLGEQPLAPLLQKNERVGNYSLK